MKTKVYIGSNSWFVHFTKNQMVKIGKEDWNAQIVPTNRIKPITETLDVWKRAELLLRDEVIRHAENGLRGRIKCEVYRPLILRKYQIS